MLLVDVGGNLGYDISRFEKTFPDLAGKYVLQDLLSRIECMKHNFFTP